MVSGIRKSEVKWSKISFSFSSARPGGDIVVSGLSARARSVFRVVTSLSPPFVMESNLDEDGLCLRGLPCHRLSTSGQLKVAPKIYI